MNFSCRVYGLPVAQGRPRAFAIPGRGIRVYDPKESRAWKEVVREQAISQRPEVPDEGALTMKLIFWLPRPKSLPKRTRHHVKRPDLDNLAKAVKDALRGLVYKDDSQVVHLNVSKHYSPLPGVDIDVETLHDDKHQAPARDSASVEAPRGPAQDSQPEHPPADP